MQPPDPLERALTNALANRFFQRQDLLAYHDGEHYRPLKKPLSGPLLLEHIRGERVLGTYLLDTENRCRFFTFDLDFNATGRSYRVDMKTLEERLTADPNCHDAWLKDLWSDEPEDCNPREVWTDDDHPLRPWLALQLRCLAEGIAWQAASLYPYPVAVAYSGGKGLHVHVFCGERTALAARNMGNLIITSFPNWFTGEDSRFVPVTGGSNSWRDSTDLYSNITIEIYPKQDVLGEGGYGNLVRVPLGIHPTSRRKSYFIDLGSIPAWHPLAEFDPLIALTKGCIPR